jgi:HD-GYP domain-containing protein (c-di-GMP phosphodiesterase class II)
MKKSVDLSILSLDWASGIMGAHMEVGNLMRVIVSDLKSRIPAKKISLFLWDESKNKFILKAETDKNDIVTSPHVKNEITKALLTKDPEFSGRSLLLPLRSKGVPLGVLSIEFSAKEKASLKDKNAIGYMTKMVATVLSNAKLFIESEMRTQDMFRFNVLSRALNPTVNEEEIVKILIEGLGGIIKFDIGGLLVLGKQTHKLFIKAWAPVTKNNINAVKNNLLKLILNVTKNPLDTNKLKERINFVETKGKTLKINSSLDAPLITKGKIVGVLTLCGLQKDQFSARDHQNISILASHGAVAFENARLYEDLRRTYFSIINALTSAIEAKDEYTRGHSVLVSKYSVAIASELGLSSTMVESIQIAGLLHDLGKIGVPEEILVKKGKLTDNEFEVVKAHPEIAMKILGPVEFPSFTQRQTQNETYVESPPELTLNLFEEADLSSDVKLMIFHHHEKFAGGGYPKGIKGDEIPLGARILAVSDTFEALTANRPYRKAFTEEEAVKILLQISGEQLDPKITNLFIKLLKTKGIEYMQMGGF